MAVIVVSPRLKLAANWL